MRISNDPMVSAKPLTHVDVLLLADAHSIWTLRYIQKVLLVHGKTVALAAHRISQSPFYEILANSRITLIELPSAGRAVSWVPRLRGILKRRLASSEIRRQVNFDAVHVHRLQKDQMLLADRLRRSCRVVVLSYWGSDLLRTPTSQLIALRKVISRADVLTYNALAMRVKIEQLYGDIAPVVRYVPFGIGGFDAIERVDGAEGRAQSRERFGLPGGRAVVVLGYNGRVEQQHLALLKHLGALPTEVKEAIYCLVPMTYMNAGVEYEERVTSAIRDSGLVGALLTSFLDESDQARLALATDVFINAQTTDALSATLQEFIYAGCRVLSGSWLDYSELDPIDLTLDLFTQFEELPHLLVEALNNPICGKVLTRRRKSLALRSWEVLAPQWLQLYELQRARTQG